MSPLETCRIGIEMIRLRLLEITAALKEAALND